MNWKVLVIISALTTTTLQFASSAPAAREAQPVVSIEEALSRFGVPYAHWQKIDLSGLDPIYQEMALRLLSVPVEERPPIAVCVAPGTPYEVVEKLERLLYSGRLDYELGNRWSWTAHGGTGGQGDPITLTYSYVPDGVWVPGGAGEPGSPNVLFATLDAQFGSTALWQSKIAQVFARWSELTGITYVEENDDGASLFNSSGSIGVRGDVRFCSHDIDGGYGILAYNYYPNGGDMCLDASEYWANSSNDFRFFRNVVAHEHGHGIGLAHVCPANGTKLMEPYLTTSYDGPQHDDQRAGQRHYGDRYEDNGSSGSAENLGSVEGNYMVTEVCMDDNGESDYYKFTVVDNRMVSITLTPVGLEYQAGPEVGNCDTGDWINSLTINNLDLYLYDTNGSTLLASSTSQPAGSPETIVNFILPSAGTFYARVVSGPTNDVQTYEFEINVEKPLILYTPNGSEIWYSTRNEDIVWNSGLSGTVTISLDRNYPSGIWEMLFSGTANDGIESWPVTGPETANARIRIISDSSPTDGDTSDAGFTITDPYVLVTSPNGGEIWYDLESNIIYWQSGGVLGNMDISINRDFPAGAWDPLFTNTLNDGAEQWIVTGPQTSNVRIRVVSVNTPHLRDSSDADFTIFSRYITMTAPNGGETWYVDDAEDITWESGNFSGTISISINFSYPGGGWQNIVAGTDNDGVHPWQVALPPTSNARIRIISDTYPSVGDTSDGNFTISDGGMITVTTPNGGEVWFVSETEDITWLSGGISGNVTIELDRAYPSSWETLFASTADDGIEPWPITAPVTNQARVQITSISQPSVSDVSDNDFTIMQDDPPVIVHAPKDDGEPGYVLFVADVTDELPGSTVRLFSRSLGAGAYDTTDMESTGNPDEYSATLSLVDTGTYEYYIEATDVGSQVSTTDVYDFQLYSFCGTTISYDNGSADRFNWAGEEEFRWAVRFTPPATPFLLCGARFSASPDKPDAVHTRIYVEVYSESGGLPGALLFSDTTGSIGNLVGGLQTGQTHWADVMVRDGSSEPLELYGDFFIAVGNPDTLLYEAFSRDTTSTNSDRSFLYDGCTEQWYNENDAWENCKVGNRLIRALGYVQSPPEVVVYRAGNDAELHWTSTGAPYYRIYSDTTPFGVFGTLEGSTTDTIFMDVDAINGDLLKFYRITSATLP